MATWYCDYTNGDDTTGSGTSGAPYKTVQKCVNVATGGDTINIANTSAQVLAAPISWSSGWTADNTKYTIFQPWNNGGSITIQRPDEATARDAAFLSGSGGATNSFSTTSIPQKIVVKNIHFKDFSDRGIKLQANWQVIGCEFSTNATVSIQVDNNQTLITNCYIHDASSDYYNVSLGGGEFSYNFLDNLTAGTSIISAGQPHDRILNNIIIMNYNTDVGISNFNVANYIEGNTFVSNGGTSQVGISGASTSDLTIYNNLFYNFDGASSKPISWAGSSNARAIMYNAYFDCNASDSPTNIGLTGGDVTGTGDPFVDSANDDYTLDPTAGAAAIGAGLGNP